MEIRRALVVGGSNGIGLSITKQLLDKKYTCIYIVDRYKPDILFDERVKFIRFNLLNDDYSIFDDIKDIDTLIITAGFGRVALFENIEEIEIINSFKVNSIAAIRLIKKYYPLINSEEDFYCSIMGSIAGLISSPLFAVYGATKAALIKFIESINIELEESDSPNRILNISPGSIKGTKFNKGNNDIALTASLAKEILKRMYAREEQFIPDYKKTYKNVLGRYNKDSHKFGIDSYKYKQQSGRISNKPQIKIGYLSGTFDLFHIGHLNIIRKAKNYCDYLVVGVHKDASHKNKEVFIPFEERIEIVKNIKYVDKVIQSYPEDSDAYKEVKFDYLFVGSDYKGSERFNRYENYFKDKNVKIIYLPYTTQTSSTKIRYTIDTAIDEIAPTK